MHTMYRNMILLRYNKYLLKDLIKSQISNTHYVNGCQLSIQLLFGLQQAGGNKPDGSLFNSLTTYIQVKMNSKNISFSELNSYGAPLTPYRYPFFIKGFRQLYKGKWPHISLLLSFFTDRSNQFNFLTRFLQFNWAFRKHLSLVLS